MVNNKGTANKKLIKKINTNAILNVIRAKGSISRAGIAKELKLNPATVSSNVNDLIKQGLVLENGSGHSNGGRRPIMLELNSNNTFIIGVYTEITSILIGVVNLNGEVINKVTLNLNDQFGASDDYMINRIISGIESIIDSNKIDGNHIIGIGVGLHGLVDPILGKSIFAPAYNWHNVEVAKRIQNYFNIETHVDNDVRAMALGEKWFGKAKKSDNFLLLHIGEGVGGAILTNGNLYFGTAFGAGEIGHIKVTQRAIKCNCGNYGCLTTVASEEGIIKRMQTILKKNPSAYEGQINVEQLTVLDIVEMAENGNRFARIILEQTGDYIGRAIGAIINILNPERVLLTGKVLAYERPMMEAIKESAKKQCIADNFMKTTISPVSIKEDLEIVGSATIIVDKIFSL